MRLDFSGEHRIAAPRDLVWRLLLDPDVVGSCSKGLERIEVLDATHWIVHVALGFGPLTIRIPFHSRMRNLQEPSSAEMWLDGHGAGTDVRLRTAIRLEAPDAGLTELHWEATSEVEGVAAGLGHRLVEATAKSFTTDFWRRFAEAAALRAARTTAEQPVPEPVGPVEPRRVVLDLLPAPMMADVRGEGRGHPVVLLHGMWCERGMFDGMAEALAHTAEVIVPDLRGHGEAAIRPAGWGVPDLAQDVIHLLDGFGIERADVVGFSMGGMALIPLALRWPERVRALVFVSASAEGEGPVRQAQMRLLAGVLRTVGAQPKLLEAAPGYMFSQAFRVRSPAVVRAWLGGVERMPGEALAQAMEAVASRPDWTAQLAGIPHPALVVAGAADTTIPPPHSERLAAGLPLGRLVTLPEVGHAVPVERPQELAAVVRAFLGERGAGSGR
jgi:3-oxoadipate enol-lactonase